MTPPPSPTRAATLRAAFWCLALVAPLLAVPVRAAVIAAGADHSIFVKSDGTVWTMGNNSFGQLGTGNTTAQPLPVQIATDAIAVATGADFSLYLEANNTLWGMGDNSNGQLATGNSTNQLTPVLIASDVTAMSAGSHHTIFLKGDGTVWTVGHNEDGQLGIGNTNTQKTPVQVAINGTLVTNAIAVAAYNEHSHFITADNTLWSMGINGNGQLANGTSSVLQSLPVFAQAGVAAVAPGSSHTLYITTALTLYAVGTNTDGELGDNSTTNLISPTVVAGPVIAASGGDESSMFIKADHSLWGMGNNTSGQLGDGTEINRHSPLLITYSIASVDLGYPGTFAPHTFYVTTNGTLMAMGDNHFGQLGDGTTTTRLYPVPIATGLPVAPIVNAPLSNLTVFATQTATFTANISAAPANYQWQRLPAGSSTWANLTDDSTYNGTATPTLAVSATDTSMNGDQFQLLVSNFLGSANTTAATLTVQPSVAPNITSQSSSQIVNVGQTATFSANVTGSPAPTLQWQVLPSGSSDWANLSNNATYNGTTTATLRVLTTLDLSGDQYQLLAASTAGSTNSTAVLLTVNAVAPAFPTQPSNQTVFTGQTATFAANVTGAPTPSLQWQVLDVGSSTWANLTDNSTYNGTATATLKVLTSLALSGSQYQLLANNVGGPANSTIVLLAVSKPVAPSLTVQPVATVVLTGKTASLSIQAAGTAPLKYQWYKNIAPISGATSATLNLTKVALTANNTKYYVIVTGPGGAIQSKTVTLTVLKTATAVKIATQPKALTVKPGAKATFTVKASGTAPLLYQWQKGGVNLVNGGVISGATTATLTITKAATANQGSYRVIISNPAGKVTSAAVSLTVH